jgi:hypothetical protein
MIFIGTAIIFCILAVHNINENKYTAGAVFLIFSAFLPLALQQLFDRNMTVTATTISSDTHRGGNGYHRVGNGYDRSETAERILVKLDELQTKTEDCLRLLQTHQVEVAQSQDASEPTP